MITPDAQHILIELTKSVKELTKEVKELKDKLESAPDHDWTKDKFRSPYNSQFDH